MIKKCKIILSIVSILELIINSCSVVKADNIEMQKNILIIASYSYDNEWEKNIIAGIRDYYDGGYLIKAEYLDSTAYESREYYEKFSNLLNMKYRDDVIDYIITLDDEAFNFASENLMNEDSVCYKKPMFCLGLNTEVQLTDEERKYISGIVDTQNGKEFLKLVKSATPKVKNICLLLNESAYCEAFKKSIIEENNLLELNYVISYIKSNYIQDIAEEIKKLDLESYAFILVGAFNDKNTAGDVDSAYTVKTIQSLSDAVLYTTLEGYVNEGAFGGFINNGYNLGKTGASQFERIIKNNLNYGTFNIVSNLFDACLINYKALRHYNINPFNIPENAVYLQKERYNLLLPEYMIFMMKAVLSFTVIIIAILIYFSIKNRRNERIAKLKLFQSEEREKIKNNFIIIISHELRTPLNVIISTIKLLKLKIVNDQYEKDYFLEKMDYMISNSNRLLRSVNNYIDIARIESNIIDISFTMENLVEVIDEVVDVTADYIKGSNVEIIFDPEEEVIDCAIDKEKIERILFNIISNALKNIKRKDGCIFIKCSKDSEKIYLSVEDNGVGISEDNKKNIFDRFYQYSSDIMNRECEGSGLGLYITKKLVEIHDGDISVDSILGKGSTFYITIPVKIVDEKLEKCSGKQKGPNELAALEFSDITNIY